MWFLVVSRMKSNYECCLVGLSSRRGINCYFLVIRSMRIFTCLIKREAINAIDMPITFCA